MPLISKLGLDDVYKAMKGSFREIRARSVRLRAAAAAGPVSFTAVREFYEALYQQIAYCDSLVAKFGGAVIQSYAREQEDSATYAPGTEYTTMKNAANAVLTHVAGAIPGNSAHTVANGVVVEPTFSVAQTATLRGLLDTLTATIDAP